MVFLPTRGRGEYPLFSFRSELGRLFDDFLDLMPERTGLIDVPAVDVSETEQAVEIHMELAGIKPEDVQINADESMLTIKGEKKVERDEKNASWHVTERSFGSFTRVIPLPATVDADKAKAEYKDGVLTVSMPKIPEAKPKNIEIAVK